MADGVTHARFGRLIIASNAALAVTKTHTWVTPGFAAGTVVGTVLGFLMPPDLDLPQRTYDEWRIINRAPLIGRLWVGFWASYGQMFDHRKISHRFILGTISRILWIFRHLFISFVVVLVWAGFGYVELVRSPDFALWFRPHDFWAGVFAGWVAQDAGHLFLDGELRLIPRFNFTNGTGKKRRSTQRRYKPFRPLQMEI